MNTKLTAIIVSYNSQDTIGSALSSLAPAHESGLIECVVVDNASEDKTVGVVQQYPWATLLQNDRNMGFGTACNRGLHHANTDYVMFMNPDAIIPYADLAALVRFLDAHPAAGMVAPAVIEADGTFQTAGALPTPVDILLEVLGIDRGRRVKRPIKPGDPPFKTDWLCGAVVLARTNLLNEIGGFDQTYFLYFEESDLCRRVCALGYELWAMGEAVARHAANHSARGTRKELYAGCIAEHYFPSRHYYLVKHYGTLAAIATELMEIVLLACRAAMARTSSHAYRHLVMRLRAPLFHFPNTRRCHER